MWGRKVAAAAPRFLSLCPLLFHPVGLLLQRHWPDPKRVPLGALPVERTNTHTDTHIHTHRCTQTYTPSHTHIAEQIKVSWRLAHTWQVTGLPGALAVTLSLLLLPKPVIGREAQRFRAARYKETHNQMYAYKEGEISQEHIYLFCQWVSQKKVSHCTFICLISIPKNIDSQTFTRMKKQERRVLAPVTTFCVWFTPSITFFPYSPWLFLWQFHYRPNLQMVREAPALFFI